MRARARACIHTQQALVRLHTHVHVRACMRRERHLFFQVFRARPALPSQFKQDPRSAYDGLSACAVHMLVHARTHAHAYRRAPAWPDAVQEEGVPVPTTAQTHEAGQHREQGMLGTKELLCQTDEAQTQDNARGTPAYPWTRP